MISCSWGQKATGHPGPWCLSTEENGEGVVAGQPRQGEAGKVFLPKGQEQPDLGYI